MYVLVEFCVIKFFASLLMLSLPVYIIAVLSLAAGLDIEVASASPLYPLTTATFETPKSPVSSSCLVRSKDVSSLSAPPILLTNTSISSRDSFTLDEIAPSLPIKITSAGLSLFISSVTLYGILFLFVSSIGASNLLAKGVEANASGNEFELTRNTLSEPLFQPL